MTTHSELIDFQGADIYLSQDTDSTFIDAMPMLDVFKVENIILNFASEIVDLKSHILSVESMSNVYSTELIELQEKNKEITSILKKILKDYPEIVITNQEILKG